MSEAAKEEFAIDGLDAIREKAQSDLRRGAEVGDPNCPAGGAGDVMTASPGFASERSTMSLEKIQGWPSAARSAALRLTRTRDSDAADPDLGTNEDLGTNGA